MKEFNMKNGSCFGALSFAVDEARARGIKYGTQEYFDFIARRKMEIWEALENKTYKFNA